MGASSSSWGRHSTRLARVRKEEGARSAVASRACFFSLCQKFRLPGRGVNGGTPVWIKEIPSVKAPSSLCICCSCGLASRSASIQMMLLLLSSHFATMMSFAPPFAEARPDKWLRSLVRLSLPSHQMRVSTQKILCPDSPLRPWFAWSLFDNISQSFGAVSLSACSNPCFPQVLLQI